MEYIGIIETKEGIFYIEKYKNYLYAGVGCNAGIIRHDKFKMNECFSLDENLQNFVEVLFNKYGNINWIIKNIFNKRIKENDL